jgi:squalene synthase HpnC
MKSESDIISGYNEAIQLAKSHYENFPVVSFLIPSNLRKHVALVYWFARTADDIADENNYSEVERLTKLDAIEERFHSPLKMQTADNLMSALKNTITSKNLNPENFLKLLKAFRQDVTKKRYSTFDEVLEYCSCSANPVGRILLELFNIRNDKANYYSDKICTALQITNFLQDTDIDYQKGRIYYPAEEMQKFGVSEKMFEIRKNNSNLKELIEFSVNRVMTLFNEGKPLLEYLSGRFKYEIDWTIKGGETILNKIRGADFDVFSNRPVLTKTDHLRILMKVFFRQ